MISNNKKMNPIILSCRTLTEYVQQAQITCGTAFPVVELDRQYHVEPAKMREHILETLQQLPDEIDTVLVAMGFCGGSWQDVSLIAEELLKDVSEVFF